MQREILYKAKRKDGKWVEGLPRCMNYKRLKKRTNLIDGIEDEEGYVWEIDPETLCKWTGYNDSEGSILYFGDLVKMIMPACEVTGHRENPVGTVIMHRMEICAEMGDVIQRLAFVKEFEIIGNIHDKKEG